MGWLGSIPKTYIFSSFFSTLHSTNKTNNQQNASKWGISWMCEKYTDSNYNSYYTNRDPLAKLNKRKKQTLDDRSCYLIGSGDRTRVQKDIFPLQKHQHYFVYSTSTSVHLHTTWLFFNVPSSKAKVSLSTNTTTTQLSLTHTQSHKHIISTMLANHCQTPPNLSHPSVTVNLNPPRGIFTYNNITWAKQFCHFDWLLMIVNYFYANLLLLLYYFSPS